LEGDGGDVLGIEEFSRGSDGLVDAYPDRVFSPALEKHCKSLILVHNHPRGFLYPSYRDRTATWNLLRDGREWGIEVLDSVIIALGGYYSFREEGEIRQPFML